jgi:hypothetical protein
VAQMGWVLERRANGCMIKGRFRPLGRGAVTA